MKRALTGLCGSVLLAALPATADVRIEQHSEMTMSMLGSTNTIVDSVETISADKARRESDVDYKGGFMGMIPKQHQVRIDRIDKSLSWALDPKKKTYRESPYGQVRDAFANAGQNKKPKKVHVVSAEVKVAGPLESKTINSYACTHYRVSLKMVLEDEDTKQRSTQTIADELWTTPETGDLGKVRAEQQAINLARMKAMGLEVDTSDWSSGFEGAFAMAGIDAKELATALKVAEPELKKLKGFPIVTEFDWKMEGQGGAKTAQNSRGSDGSQTSSDQGIPTNPVAALGAFMGSRKSDKPASSAGADSFCTGRTEVKKAEATTATADLFEVPSDYSKIDK